jgi:hypothetical protein
MKVRYIVDDMSTGAAWMGFGRSQAAKMAAAGVSRRHFPLGDVTVDIRVFDQDNAQVRISGAPTLRGFVFGLELTAPPGRGGVVVRTPVRRWSYGTYERSELPDEWVPGSSARAWQTALAAYSVVESPTDGVGRLRNGKYKKAPAGIGPLGGAGTYVRSGENEAYLPLAYEVHPDGAKVWREFSEYTVNFGLPASVSLLRTVSPLLSGGTTTSTTSRGTTTLPDVDGVVGGSRSLGEVTETQTTTTQSYWTGVQYDRAGNVAPIGVTYFRNIESRGEKIISYAGPFALDTPPPTFITAVVAENQEIRDTTSVSDTWNFMVTVPWTTTPLVQSSGNVASSSVMVRAPYHPERDFASSSPGEIAGRTLAASILFYDARARECVWSYREYTGTAGALSGTVVSRTVRDVRGTRTILSQQVTTAEESGLGGVFVDNSTGAACTSGGLEDVAAVYPTMGLAPNAFSSPAFRSAVLAELGQHTVGAVKADILAGALDGYSVRPYYNVSTSAIISTRLGVLVT